MEKKPKLLDKRRIILVNDEPLLLKIIDQNLKGINDFEMIKEQGLDPFLAKVFMTEPKIVLLCLKNLAENIDYAKHLRNNSSFENLPIAIVSNPPEKENIVLKNKISSLKINYFPIPVIGNELTKFIRDSLDK